VASTLEFCLCMLIEEAKSSQGVASPTTNFPDPEMRNQTYSRTSKILKEHNRRKSKLSK